MHYYIDGYNLLFRLSWSRSQGSLETTRRLLIEALDQKASLLGLTITIIFDAPLQSEELRRSHFRTIEIIFTALGQTADTCLLEIFEQTRSPHAITLVSSDKPLQRKANALGIRSQSVEEFLKLLERRSLKKQRIQKNKKIEKKVVTKSKKNNSKTLQSTALPALFDLEKWEEIFENQLEREL